MLYLMVTCSIIQIYDIPSTSHPNVHHTQDSSITEFILNGRYAGSDEPIWHTSDKSVPLISVLFVWTEPSRWNIVLCVILHSMPVLWNERLKSIYQLWVLHRHHCSSAATSTIKRKSNVSTLSWVEGHRKINIIVAFVSVTQYGLQYQHIF